LEGEVRSFLIATIAMMAAGAYAQPATEAALVRDGKRLVVESLRDPDSAQFRGLFLSKYTIQVNGAPRDVVHLCGSVNAKNGYGGYAGFARFIADQDAVEIEKDGDGARSYFLERWRVDCTPKYRDVK
jgi:hypothetical protein